MYNSLTAPEGAATRGVQARLAQVSWRIPWVCDCVVGSMLESSPQPIGSMTPRDIGFACHHSAAAAAVPGALANAWLEREGAWPGGDARPRRSTTRSSDDSS